MVIPYSSTLSPKYNKIKKTPGVECIKLLSIPVNQKKQQLEIYHMKYSYFGCKDYKVPGGIECIKILKTSEH
jgi:hypothetical protein